MQEFYVRSADCLLDGVSEFREIQISKIDQFDILGLAGLELRFLDNDFRPADFLFKNRFEFLGFLSPRLAFNSRYERSREIAKQGGKQSAYPPPTRSKVMVGALVAGGGGASLKNSSSIYYSNVNATRKWMFPVAATAPCFSRIP